MYGKRRWESCSTQSQLLVSRTSKQVSNLSEVPLVWHKVQKTGGLFFSSIEVCRTATFARNRRRWEWRDMIFLPSSHQSMSRIRMEWLLTRNEWMVHTLSAKSEGNILPQNVLKDFFPHKSSGTCGRESGQEGSVTQIYELCELQSSLSSSVTTCLTCVPPRVLS